MQAGYLPTVALQMHTGVDVNCQKISIYNNGDFVCLESPRGKVDVKARITDEVKPGILSTTFHFPEIMVNNITSDIHDTEAMCPEYKVVAVRIRKSKGKFKQLVEAQREN